MLPITAIISSRNEWPYLKHLLPYLEKQNIDAIVIDNGSTDPTLERLQAEPPSNLKKVVHLPYTGVCDVTAIVEAKMVEARALNEGWIINHDSDELMQAPDRFGGLRSEIELAEARGFNAINLREIVMLPAKPAVEDHINNNLNYYYFGPAKIRLMRIWKANLSGTMVNTAGHRFEGEDVRLSDRHLILRHYIVRSQAHAIQKYLHLKYADHDIARGWVRNRLNFTRPSLSIPRRGRQLKSIPNFEYGEFDLSEPLQQHFWQWKNETRLARAWHSLRSYIKNRAA